MEKVTWTRGVC